MSFKAFLQKDMRIEWRSRDTFAASLTVAVLFALLANVAFFGRANAERAVAGSFWMAVVFAAQVGLARTFVIEKERGTFEGVVASPGSLVSMWASKFVVHAVVLAAVAVVAGAALILAFRMPMPSLGLGGLLVLVLGIVGVALVTTMTAAMAMHGAHWVLLVPLLSLPLMFPIVATAVPATDLLLIGAPLEAVLPHLRVLAAFDIVVAVSAWLLVPFVLEP